MNTDDSNSPEQSVPALESKPAVLRATITITRKATGKTETFDIIGTPEAPPQAHDNEAR